MRSLEVATIGAIRTAPAPPPRRLIGRGRSGCVFLDHSVSGETIAAKVFTGDRLADMVHLLLSGASNPYRWNEDAVRTAYWRRRLLAELVRYWLPDRLEVADARAVAWNSELRAWELHARFISGFPVALHHPFSAPRDAEQCELLEIMRRLQGHLLEAGLAGLAWQAGLGNPVAANNFLTRDRRTRGGATPSPRWSWIDLESGVPALFPLDPRPLLSLYLPLSIRNRRPLFDDVDIPQLETYLLDHRSEITTALGADTFARIEEASQHLDRHQQAWHAVGRLRGGVEAALAKGEIDAGQARHYLARPGAWLARQFARLTLSLASSAAKRVRRGLAAIGRVQPLALAASTARFLTSQRFRSRAARLYVLRRIRYWRRRRQLGGREAAWLRRAARRDDDAAYLTDFAVHLAIKPVYKGVALVGLPLMAQAGLIPLWLMAAGMVFAGTLCRSAYTGYRVAQSVWHRRPPPWLALLVGLTPIVGSVAFPAQIVHSSGARGGKLAGLILYDIFTAIGRRVPIWGGEDTATEHFFNRIADRIVPRRDPLVATVRPAD